MNEIPVCLSNTELFYVVLKGTKISYVKHGYSPKRILPRFLSTPTLNEIKIKVFQYQYGDKVMDVLQKVSECLNPEEVKIEGKRKFIPAKIPADLEEEIRELVKHYKRIK